MPTLADDVRALTAQYMAGGYGSFDAFRDLVQKLLSNTVLVPGQQVRLGGTPEVAPSRSTSPRGRCRCVFWAALTGSRPHRFGW